MMLLSQAAHIRAALFHLPVPQEITLTWLLERLFNPKPKAFTSPITPTRQFCLDLLTSKVKATIGELGTMIGWEDDNEVVGPIALAAKSSLLRLIPHILPVDDEDNNLYRFKIEHGDFGVHNMSIELQGEIPQITSLYDWEVAHIVPAILSNPQMAVTVDLDVNGEAVPIVTRLDEDETEEDLKEYQSWSNYYYKVTIANPFRKSELTCDLDRYSSIKPLSTKKQSRLGKMHDISGSSLKPGEVELRRSTLELWEHGVRRDWKSCNSEVKKSVK